MLNKAVCLLLVLSTPVVAQPRDVAEKEAVVEIFGALIPKFDVEEGDGLGSDVDCVFSRQWDQSFHRDAEGNETEAFRPRELLSLEAALDPSSLHSSMFCDYSQRDAQAQKRAIDEHKRIRVATVGLSYPDFNPDLDSAIVYYQRWSKLLYPSTGKRDVPVGSNGFVKFHRALGVWSFEIVHTGTMN